jgi:hypothetical protein
MDGYILDGLSEQVELVEKNTVKFTDKIKDVDNFINCRINRINKLILAMDNSNDWMNELPKMLKMLNDIQYILNRIEEISAIMTHINE